MLVPTKFCKPTLIPYQRQFSAVESWCGAFAQTGNRDHSRTPNSLGARERDTIPRTPS
jgi:hypothetical protein